MSDPMLSQIQRGRTDSVFEYLAAGNPATTVDNNGVSLIQWCAYYGDVSALKHLLAHGAFLSQLGDNFDLNGAAFHGHWRLCQFLLEQRADPNQPLSITGETPLHAGLSRGPSPKADRVVRVLLAHGAEPNVATLSNVPTECFMRDARTRGETPLHRAAAFGSETAIELLLQAGADVQTRDSRGETPLAWASWHRRPDAILRLLCFGPHRIHPDRRSMSENLLGDPEQLVEPREYEHDAPASGRSQDAAGEGRCTDLAPSRPAPTRGRKNGTTGNANLR